MADKKPALLTRLRAKNEHEKKVFAFTIAIAVTVIIFIVWFISFTITSREVIKNEEKNKETNGPFKTLIDQIKKGR